MKVWDPRLRKITDQSEPISESDEICPRCEKKTPKRGLTLHLRTCDPTKLEEKKATKTKYRKVYGAKARAELREWLDDLKIKRRCGRCGYSKCPQALDFHHINPSIKTCMISELQNKTKILKEIKKCELLCSNCHAEHHHPPDISRYIS